jgi:hypothetical protein
MKRTLQRTIVSVGMVSVMSAAMARGDVVLDWKAINRIARARRHYLPGRVWRVTPPLPSPAASSSGRRESIWASLRTIPVRPQPPWSWVIQRPFRACFGKPKRCSKLL